MIKYRLIIFDCDGVLVDSEVISNTIMAQDIRSAGANMTDEEVLQTYVGATMAQVMSDVERRIGRPLPNDWLQTFESRRAQVFKKDLTIVPGVKEVVRFLFDNDIPFCVASQAKIEKTHLTLGLTGLLDFFKDNIFSSTMVPRPKPFPDLFLHAAKKFDVSPKDCMVIEDSPKGAAAAFAAGMKVFGYAKNSDAEKLRNAGAEIFFEMNELLKLLES